MNEPSASSKENRADDEYKGPWQKLRRLIRYYLEAVDAEHRSGVAFWAEDEGRKWIRWPLTANWKPDTDGVQRIPLRPWMGGLTNALVNAGEEASLLFGHPLLIRRVIQRKTGDESILMIPAVVWEVDWEIEGDWLMLTSQRREPGWLNPDWADEFLQKTDAKQWMDEQLEGLDRRDRSAVLMKRILGLIPPGKWAAQFSASLLGSLPSLSREWMQGVYPAGILGIHTSSRYTKGLEQELRWIADKVSDAEIDSSSLAIIYRELREPLLSRQAATAELPDIHGVFPPPDRPLNREQLMAVRGALTKDASLVIGPPGTGKTDVAAAVGLNAALQGRSVLICSRNNVAVQEVETRLRSIGDELNQKGSAAIEVSFVHRAGSSWGGKNYTTGDEALRRAIPAVHRILGSGAGCGAAVAGTSLQHHPMLLEQKNLLADWATAERAVIEFQKCMDQCLASAFPESFQEGDDSGWVDRLDFSNAERKLNDLSRHADIQEWLAGIPLGRFWLATYRWLNGRRVLDLRNHLSMDLQHEVIGSDLSAAAEWRKRLAYARDLNALKNAEAALSGLPTSSMLVARAERLQADIQHELKRVGSGWFRRRLAMLSEQERQSLSRLKELLIIGEGKGLKSADRRKLEAERVSLGKVLTKILPIWCCTNLSLRKRLALSPGLFDVVLIDEASQCDPASAIPILFRGKRAVAIGDNNQLRHVSRLSSEEDERLFAGRSLGAEETGFLYSKFSFFDVVEKFVDRNPASSERHQLLLHYRCHEEIIGFSSLHFYGGTLEVMTSDARLKVPRGVSPGISWSHVRGPIEKGETGSISDTEAYECIRVFKKLMADRLFDGTVGIVTPFRQQANRIRQRIEQDLPLDVLERHKLEVDTAHAFQGGQRDVIIMSLMYAEEMPGGSKTFIEREPNLFNVAISRAAAALWVVGDLEACRGSSIIHLRSFAAYFDTMEKKRSEPTQSPLSSIWEGRLQGHLEGAGIRTFPQHRVDRYFLDLAYISSELNLAIEVDGEAYHLDDRGRRLTSDIARDLKLRSLGWRVIRFWVWQVRNEPDTCVKKVLDLISEASRSKESSTDG